MTAEEEIANIRKQVYTEGERLFDRLVVLIGVGSVGSVTAALLAREGVGHMRFIDHDRVELKNIRNQEYDLQDVGEFKATCLQSTLMARVPGLVAEAEVAKVDDSMTNTQLDALLDDADVVVIATDDVLVQRRVAGRCLQLRRFAVLPAVWENGGEIFVQFTSADPCYLCWDEPTRPTVSQQRRANAQWSDSRNIAGQTAFYAIGLLDPDASGAELTHPDRGSEPIQLYTRTRDAETRVSVRKREVCDACGGRAAQRIEPVGVPGVAPRQPVNTFTSPGTRRSEPSSAAFQSSTFFFDFEDVLRFAAGLLAVLGIAVVIGWPTLYALDVSVRTSWPVGWMLLFWMASAFGTPGLIVYALDR